MCTGAAGMTISTSRSEVMVLEKGALPSGACCSREILLRGRSSGITSEYKMERESDWYINVETTKEENIKEEEEEEAEDEVYCKL